MALHEFAIDDRVECEGFIGTVKYIGPVDGTDGEWIGIEWDDKNRGKHNGCVNGKRYFETLHSNSGSLMRPHKLNSGISFMDAVKQHYSDITEMEALNLPQIHGRDRSIELIGFDKVSRVQSELKNLKELSVQELRVSYCDSECSQISDMLCQIETLNLSKNLISSWAVIAKIVESIPNLSNLMLSYNKLRIPNDNDVPKFAISSLRTLILDNVDYDWDSVLLCVSLLSLHIEHLDLWGNRISTLKSPPKPIFEHLSYLSLRDNKISSWDEICKIGHLPGLQTLNVGNCEIREIRFNGVSFEEKTLIFKELKVLYLNDNQLSLWRDIAELNKLEKLQHLSVKRNPIFESDNYEICFYLTLSKIRNLILLNHEEVTDFFRKDAEKYYLNHYFKEFSDVKNSDMILEFMNEHPRFLELISKYGEPITVNETKAEIEKRKFLILKCVCPFAENKEITKKFPASILIENFKLVCRKLFNIGRNNDINLIWKSNDFECPLEKESQSLDFYAIENNDVIIVNVD